MGDFAKFKILECSTIGQQMNWIEPCVPTTFVILFLYAIGVNEFKQWSLNDCTIWYKTHKIQCKIQLIVKL